MPWPYPSPLGYGPLPVGRGGCGARPRAVRGDGPLMLRVGGDSSDQALFRPRARDTPEWVVELSRGWLRDAGVLVYRAGVRLILDLNLLTATSQIGTTWARGAVRQLPHGSIAGFEIGNEPDIYHRRYRLRLIKEKSLADGLLPGEPAAAQYARDFVSYAHRSRPSRPVSRSWAPLWPIPHGTCAGCPVCSPPRAPVRGR